MDDEAIEKRPAFAGFGFDAREFLLGHARIMFKRHRSDFAAAGVVADKADERRNRANIGAAFPQGSDLGADIKILLLNADHRSSFASPIVF
jgi:hypothetical protein